MKKTNRVKTTVIVAALGYFVDIYDLILFSIVRKQSLTDLGVAGDQLLNVGVNLLNMQMFGMLLGGLLWGILGDKRGRVSVLFGSIFLYSIANICNGFVTSVEAYGILRFIAGIGLAGELGAAITLVSEIMSKENRGYGTTLVAAVGICGAVLAATIGDLFDWKIAYIVGGVMGLLLLILRISVYESGMYEGIKSKKVLRGDLKLLLSDSSRFKKYIACILIGVPIWFVIGVLVTFSPEIGGSLGVEGILSSKAIMYCYIGLAVGDLASGFMSQWLRSRKKVLKIFLSLTLVLLFVYVFATPKSVESFYSLCALLGFGIGYWAVFVTVGAEQFGTNLRATVATTTPNFVRGSVVLVSSSFRSLSHSVGLAQSALIVGLICISIAFLAIRYLKETHGTDLNYLEI